MNIASSAAVGILVAATGGLSFYTTAVCGCLSTAQAMVSTRWAEMDPDELQKRVDKRYLNGTPESDLAQYMGADYRKYCQALDRQVACAFPHDRNFWRRTFADTTFSLGNNSRIESVRVVRRVLYVWE